MKNIATVKTEIPMSAVWLDKNLLRPDSGYKCSYKERVNLTPRIAITTKAAVSRKLYFAINFTNHCAINLIARIPMNTPIQTSIMF